MSNMHRRGLIVALGASMALLLAACGSAAGEQAQVVSVTPTSVATTAPLSVPTPTPEPVAETPVPQATPTFIPTATVVPAPSAAPTPPIEAATTETVTSELAATEVPGETDTGEVDAAEVVETPTAAPTAVPTPTVQPTASAEDGAGADGADSEPTPTPAAETPTAVVTSSGEAPLECYDRDSGVYRAHVEGVDSLSFEGGRVYCSGAGTGSGSYRHASGLIITRNGDFIFNEAGTAYIPYSGTVHFCRNGQPATAPVQAETVPALLVVIDAETHRQIAQGATAPAAFTGSGAQC